MIKTIEEKAKAYDRALEKIHQFIDGYSRREISKEELEDIFPELKESEDEKVRKELITHCRNTRCVTEEGAEKIVKWIDWLKKQGEKLKPSIRERYKRIANSEWFKKTHEGMSISDDEKVDNANNIEPKFKVGDIIEKRHNSDINKFGHFVITDIFENSYWYNDAIICDISEQDEWELVRIKPKFKVGDYVVGKYISGYISEVRDDCYLLDYQGFSIDKQDNYHLWTIQDAKDGDVLTYSDSRNNVCLCIYKEYKNERVYDYCTLDKESFWEHGNWNYLASFNYAPATKEQCDLLFQKIKEAGYEWDVEKKKLFSKPIKYNSNPPSIVKESDWSEEDDKMCQETIDWFEKKCFPYALESENPARESIKWLKSLKNRVIPQSKQEWSKEDENVLEDIEEAIINYWHGDTQDILLDWLKSLKPQNTWKPSDEQLEAVKRASNGSRAIAGNDYLIMDSLYNDLKKLKGE